MLQLACAKLTIALDCFSPTPTFVLCLWQSFFTRWWQEQTDDIKDLVRKLVDRGQLDFVNGGYVQHDEAAAHYVAMIDQTTLGHR